MGLPEDAPDGEAKLAEFYWTLRREVSLLLGAGHTHAFKYPIGRVWTEAKIVKDRIGGGMATEAVMMHGVGVALLQKRGGRHLERLLKKLRGEDDGRDQA